MIDSNVMHIKFIHVGCHKCGSTFLQEEVFPKIKNIKSIVPFSKNSPIFEGTEYLVRCGELYYSQDIAVRLLKSRLEKYKAICLSSEAFSGADTAILGPGHQIKYISERLRNIFGETKILIVIRNQRKILPSLYLDDVKYGYLVNFKQWIQWRLDTYGMNYFKYAPMVECYINFFGRQNVKTVVFEELFKFETLRDILVNFEVSTDGIENIDLNKKFNEAYSAPSLSVARIINRLFGSKLTYGSIYGPSPVNMYNLWRYHGAPVLDRISQKLNIPPPKCDFEGYNKLLFELFHEDNKKTSALTGFDLSSYGYV